ncbi:thermonuclease family protein [Rhodospirillaceae bacterium KN72]|uniref:Thermonuclease family protein n=1 Tax=Pacificispira spongiicola TaxID=2729598 RepID=A0A7Y0E0R2_9PROT|nr:thermonuclease family protein [Pacificispira spongiicola]NMM45117.1 thermonuclease family protein [Pacificispira spongiicola]
MSKTWLAERVYGQYADCAAGAQSGFSRRSLLTVLAGAGASVAGPIAIRRSFAAPEAAASFLARVTAVDGSDRLRLADGRRVILPHILGPDRDRPMPPPTDGDRHRAAQALADRVLGREVRIDLAEPGQDRYGRLRARVICDGEDMAEWQCRAGTVRVFPEPGAAEDRIAELLRAEDAARTAAAGHWADGRFSVRLVNGDPMDDEQEAATDRFDIALGTIRRVTPIGGRLHLEFGEDWRTDFTVGLEPRAERSLPVAREFLPGRVIEARGWVRFWNGPYMEVAEAVCIRLR